MLNPRFVEPVEPYPACTYDNRGYAVILEPGYLLDNATLKPAFLKLGKKMKSSDMGRILHRGIFYLKIMKNMVLNSQHGTASLMEEVKKGYHTFAIQYPEHIARL